MHYIKSPNFNFKWALPGRQIFAVELGYLQKLNL